MTWEMSLRCWERWEASEGWSHSSGRNEWGEEEGARRKERKRGERMEREGKEGIVVDGLRYRV